MMRWIGKFALVMAVCVVLTGVVQAQVVETRETEIRRIETREVRRDVVVRDGYLGVMEDIQVWNNGIMPKTKAPPVEKSDWDKPIPMSFSVDYTLLSDHVWRGINFTPTVDDDNALVHQIGIGAEFDTQAFGAFGAVVWFSWWPDYNLVAGGDRRLNANDYTAYWRLAVPAIASELEIGWSALNFPGQYCTQEIYGKLTIDDSFIWRRWGMQSALLRPYAFWAVDYRRADWGSWIEVGLEPIWVLADIPWVQDVPIIRDIVLRPHVSMGIDARYLADFLDTGTSSTRIANFTYGFEVSYDLGHALNVPPQYGTIILTGLLNYSHAMRRDILDDKLWGGVRVTYAW